MADEHAASDREDKRPPGDSATTRADRTATLLAELRGICERIIVTNEGRAVDRELAAVPALGGSGGALTPVLEALRRESAEGRQALVELRGSMAVLRTDLSEFMEGIHQSVAGQTAATSDLTQKVAQRTAVDRSGEIEQLLTEGLPRFAQELQRRLQQELQTSVTSLQTEVTGLIDENRLSLAEQSAANHELARQVAARTVGDRTTELELLLAKDLPRFAERLEQRLAEELKSSAESLRAELLSQSAQVREEHTGSLEALRMGLAREATDERHELQYVLESLKTTLAQQSADERQEHQVSLEALRSDLAGQSTKERDEIRVMVEGLRGDRDQLMATVEALRAEQAQVQADQASVADSLRQTLEPLRADFAQRSDAIAERLAQLSTASDALGEQLVLRAAEDRSAVIEQLLREGLPKFSVELQERVQLALEGLRADRAELMGTLEALRAGQAQVQADQASVADRLRQTLEPLGADFARRSDAIGERLAQLSTAFDALGEQLKLRTAEDHSASIEQLLREGLPKFAEELQDRVQEDLRFALEAFRGSLSQFGDLVRNQVAKTAGSEGWAPDTPEERWLAMEELLSKGLPQFGRELRTGIQQTIESVSRTFMVAEAEHANRMSELFRSFEASSQRIEAALEAQQRRELNRRADRPSVAHPAD